MPRQAFGQELQRLQDEVLVLGSMVENAITESVDALYNQVYRELMTFIIASPSNIDQANFLLWAAHNLERTADRVTNICERVIFTATGKMVEMDVENSGLEGLT